MPRIVMRSVLAILFLQRGIFLKPDEEKVRELQLDMAPKS